MSFRRFVTATLTASIWFSAACCTLTTSLDSLSAEYDFIIIGGGTAGNVLASRLSEEKNVTVLVVEAGINNAGILSITVPFLAATTAGTQVDWNFTTTPQPGLNGRSIEMERGFVLGGSSSVNVLAWQRGSDDVWDNWARLTGDSGWSWSAVKKYYKKTNTLVPPSDGHDTTGQVDPAAYGNGPVRVSVPGFATELDGRVVNTSKIPGDQFIFTEDVNDGKVIGFGYTRSSVDSHAERSSSATAYLSPILNRTNLEVIIQTRAVKLLRTITSPTKFTTVELAQSANGPTVLVRARKEIILSGGVVGTPHLLLLSGIGPSSQLVSTGIKPVVDLEDVGQHLADHPLFPNHYYVNSNNTFDDILRNQTLFQQTLAQWTTNRTGVFAATQGHMIGFTRYPNNAPILHGQPNPAAGPLSANLEMIFIDGFARLGPTAQPATGHFMTIATGLVSPTSRGSITLNSTNPFVAPNIDLNILSTQFDIDSMVQTVHDAKSFISLPPWQGFVDKPFDDLAAATTDALKAELIRNTTVTLNHMVGTARMSPSNATWGVTDSRLRVKGVQGLRIVDASVFPQIPECHPQAIVYTLAERAADLIKEDNGLA